VGRPGQLTSVPRANDPVTWMERVIGYRFNDQQLLAAALTHRSASRTNNERLEFLGDAILGQVIAESLFRQFGDADEGQLTRLRARLVNKESLAEVARSLGVGDWISLGEGELKSGGFRRDSILANALEALIGAIYLDGGMQACQECVRGVFDDALASANIMDAYKDAKTSLQELLQARHLSLPVYRTVAEAGDAHQRLFTVECILPGLPGPIIGQGSSRRRAEQDAAARAMASLQAAGLVT